MKIEVKQHRPFGPTLLEAMCPEGMVDAINDFCDKNSNTREYSSLQGNTPNLLLRDIESVYYPMDFLDEIGFVDYIEKLATHYVMTSYRGTLDPAVKDFDCRMKLSPIASSKAIEGFPLADKIFYADMWANRYYSGEFTPPHNHGGSISGVLFLRIPHKEIYEDNYRNSESAHDGPDASRMLGELLFSYGGDITRGSLYSPEQLDGKIILFPSWLLHFTLPYKTNVERRTCSFNLVTQSEYDYIMEDNYGFS